jgi:hypothetical protein
MLPLAREYEALGAVAQDKDHLVPTGLGPGGVGEGVVEALVEGGKMGVDSARAAGLVFLQRADRGPAAVPFRSVSTGRPPGAGSKDLHAHDGHGEPGSAVVVGIRRL